MRLPNIRFTNLANKALWDNVLDGVRAGLAGHDIGIEETTRNIVVNAVKVNELDL